MDLKINSNYFSIRH